MDRRTIELRIAGQKYRVVTSVDEDELQRLAVIVSAKLSEVAPAGHAPQAMLLAAIALAHEAETERGRREALERRTQELLRRTLVRIDEALGDSEEADAAAAD
jgi:cell division protein ZapA